MCRASVFLVVLLSSTVAQATSLQYQFTGSVDHLGPALTSDFSLGETVVVSVTLDDTDVQTTYSTIGTYAASSLSVIIGGDYTLTGTAGWALVLDNFAGYIDSFSVAFSTGYVTGAPVGGEEPDILRRPAGPLHRNSARIGRPSAFDSARPGKP